MEKAELVIVGGNQELASFWRSEKSGFSSQLHVQVTSGVPKGVEADIWAI